MKIGFDNQKYLKIQSEHIKERIAKFGNKLYLELGGKLFDDHHASRVLPGFMPDSKLCMLQQLADKAEIVIVISAKDIEKNKVRQDLGITYDKDVLRLRKEFISRGFLVSSVVITTTMARAVPMHTASVWSVSASRLTITTPSTAIQRTLPSSTLTKASARTTMWRQLVRSSSSLLLVLAAERWLCVCRSSTTSISAASRLDMPSSRPSLCGTSHSSTLSTSPTKLLLPTSWMST